MRVRATMVPWSRLLSTGVITLLAAQLPGADAKPLIVPVRWQQAGAEPESTVEKSEDRTLAPGETAILICDMWNKHWCASATRRCGEIAEKMAPLVDAARQRGVHIIHCPSDVIDFYKDHPARARAKAAKFAPSSAPLGSWCSLDKQREGSLPIDDSDGGCDCQPQCKQHKAWSRQHPAIAILDVDIITDNGQEVYNYLVEQGIKNVIYMGVHTNMCVLGRSFGIRQMTRLGFNTLLVRDLTDTMYNPRMRPFVEHAAGTDLVVRHVERHWCPTTTSEALAAGLR